MTAAVLVDAVRTPGGRRNGSLSGWHPVDLMAAALTALAVRNDVDPAVIEEVIVGCVMQVGAQSLNLARSAALAAGWPEGVTGTTIDRQCGSSQQAVAFAAQGVMAGAYDVVVAAGVEVMSLVPMGASGMVAGVGLPFGPQVGARYQAVGGLVPQGVAAESMAQRWELSRHELDTFAARSHRLAQRATVEGRFEREIIPVVAKPNGKPNGRLNGRGVGPGLGSEQVMATDEGIRPATTAETLALMKPAFRAGGRVTAGNSAQLADGASAALVMSEAKAAALGVVPRARFHAFASAGVDPVEMLSGPILATTKVLDKAGLTLADIDVVEINEVFAAVVLAWEREHHADMTKVNVNGGAIALGHPSGATGTKLLATLLCELERSGGRYGLQTVGGSGGVANAMIIERVG